MKNETDGAISRRIGNILCRSCTATELAEWYFRNRPSGSAQASCRDEIREILSEIDILSGKHDAIHEITEAYLHFTAYILYEDGFFTNRQICDLLSSPEKSGKKAEENMATLELLNNMPVSVNPKAELRMREQVLFNSREPVYLESSQLTDLQMLCLEIPEASSEVIGMMRQRPFIRPENGEDRPYLRAFARVLYTLIADSLSTAQGEGVAETTGLQSLVAGILNSFYNEYITFPSDEYLINLVVTAVSDNPVKSSPSLPTVPYAGPTQTG